MPRLQSFFWNSCIHRQSKSPPLRLFSIHVGFRRFYSSCAVRSKLLKAGVCAAGGLAVTVAFSPAIYADAPSSTHSPESHRFRLSEVRQHGRDASTQWVTKGSKVYDITDWVAAHPGGDVILRAAGGPVDQYWNIFTIHKKKDVYDILEGFCIGDVDPRDLKDGQVPAEHVDDPFKNDPKRDARLLVLSDRPFNAETSEEDLKSFVTPNETFYVRHHMWVPEIQEAGHKLVVELNNGEEKGYTLDELKQKFPSVKILATLQCSGNRRRNMTEGSRATNGLQWGTGAISNAEWTGVRLRDVLADAGFPVNDTPDDVKHAHFVGAEAYGASIPIEKALDKLGDVLIAFEMNGKPLPLDHGYPMRIVVPGNVAARSVKWLNRIILSDEESPSQWQQRDYKCFGPNVGGNPDWDSAPAIQEMPVQSAITSLRDISAHSEQDRRLLQVYGLEEDSVAVEGYSFSGGGRRIVRVDVSANGGSSWHQAELLPDETRGAKAWAWTRWRWVLPRSQAGRIFVVKAVDEAYNTQPDHFEPHYNFRGNLASAWHRVSYMNRDSVNSYQT
ncbi:MAG: hypothetical protein Q9167_000187 [Letrouitia subvulpina]